MYHAQQHFVLASASPRRRAFLEELGIACSVAAADIDERPRAQEPPLDYAARLAQQKCASIMERHPESWVLAADTVVFRAGEIFGKPESPQHAVAILMRLSGAEHQVATSFCLGCRAQNLLHRETVISRVTFASFPESLARAYAATGEPLDKAGAYGIQGRGGVLVRQIRGSYSNVVGLPLAEVLQALCKYGIVAIKAADSA